jgi:cysteine sulfinate desulfinase/cysteine desulfurase-like protein
MGSLRISLGKDTTEADVERACTILGGMFKVKQR